MAKIKRKLSAKQEAKLTMGQLMAHEKLESVKEEKKEKDEKVDRKMMSAKKMKALKQIM